MRHELRVGDRVISYLDSATTGQVPSNTAVFLHAFPLTAAMWEPQILAAPSSWRFLAPDLRGFGHSPRGAGLSTRDPEPRIDDYADDVITLLDHVRAARAVVVGLSMGGYAAFALVRRAPERIAGLVLCDTKADADSEEARRGRAEMIALVDEQGISAVADQMIPSLLGATTRAGSPAIEHHVRRLIATNEAGGVRDALVRMIRRPDSTPLLGTVECPALVVVGDEDRVTPVDVARAMQRGIKGSGLATIAEAGHLSNVEQPDRFNEALRHFLASRLGG